MIDYVISNKQHKNLANTIAKKINAKYIQYELKIFPDGESKITINLIKKKKAIAMIIQSLNPPVDSNIIRILSLIYNTKKYVSKVLIVVPYMGYARQDKEFLSGEIITLEVITRLFVCAGVSGIIVVDIHGTTSLRKFGVPIINVTAIEELAKYIKKLQFKKKPIIISPDFGGIKRAKKLAKILNTKYVALQKNRNREDGTITINPIKTDLTSQNVIIIDDIISTGNSIIESIKILKKTKHKKIIVMCTHAILVNNAKNKIQ